MPEPLIDIRPDHWTIVRDILRKHVPQLEVWAFGSRAKWTAKEYSDLDLAVIAKDPLSLAVSAALSDDFAESDLPFKVDVVEWATTSAAFREVVRRDKVVVQEARGPIKKGVVGEWSQCALADACSSIDYGLTASASDQEVGPKFLRITDIVSGQIDWNAVPHVAADAETSAKYRLHDGDIVLARTGASTGASAYVKDPPPAVFASYLVRLQAKPEFEPRFLAYYLRSDDFWTFIRGVLGDKSAQPNASASTMTKAPLRAPRSRDEQRAIAHILGTLDDKIELNRRMNETLEAMARALFKSWFVDFDPVRAKAEGRDPGLPKPLADLFPARLVDSELGEIPQGWELRSLDKIGHFLNGLALQKYPPTDSGSLPVIKIAQLRAGNTSGSDRASADVPPDYVIQDGDILFSWSGSLECVRWAGGPGALNQHLFKVTSESYPPWLCYLGIHEHLGDFRHIAAGKATTMGHIQRHHLSDAKLPVPPTVLLRAMDAMLDPIIGSLWRRDVMSRTLAAIRDTLLPKLISGELRVQHVEKVIEKAL